MSQINSLFLAPVRSCLFLTLSLIVLTAATAAPPPLVISEIQAEGTSPLNDAIEIFNATGDDVDLEGWTVIIYDQNDNVAGTMTLPQISLKSEEFLILTEGPGQNTASTLYFPGVSIFWQSNEPGACALLDSKREGVDFVRWDGSNVMPPAPTSFLGDLNSSAMNRGVNLSRDRNATDTDSSEDWCLRSATLGSRNEDHCLSDAIRISEVNSDAPGDVIELYNRGSVAHNIGNLRLLVYNENDTITDTLLLPDFTLQPGAFVLIHDIAGTDTATDIFIDSALIFWEANEPGALALLDGSTSGIDFVRWDESQVLPPPGTGFSGAIRSSAMNHNISLSRNSSQTDTDQASNWCLRTYTPKLANGEECMSDAIRINEIGAEGPADRIELFNRGTVTHNIEHLQLLIYDQNDVLSDTLVLPSFNLSAGGHVVIHDRAGINDGGNIYLDGALIFWEAAEPGACALLDGSVHGIDFVRWDASAVSPPPGTGFGGGNPSAAMTPTLTLSRRSDGSDTGTGGDWLIDTETFGGSNPEPEIDQILSIDPRNRTISFMVSGMEPGSRIGLESRVKGGPWTEISLVSPLMRSENFRVDMDDENTLFLLRAVQK